MDSAPDDTTSLAPSLGDGPTDETATDASAVVALPDAPAVVPSYASDATTVTDVAAEALTDVTVLGIEAGPEGGKAASAGSLPARVLLYYLGAVPTIPMQSIVNQLAFYERTLSGWGFVSDETVDPTTITDANLARYAALAMINTCFEPFGAGKPDTPQSQVIERFLQGGGGLFGTHCADVTFQSASPPVLYNQLIGGRGGDGFFDGQNTCRKLADHPSTVDLPATFPFSGNLDNTDFIASDSTVLVKCTWMTPSGKDVSVSWYRDEGLGRVFYTDFAKTDTDLSDPVIGTHVVAGLAWVLHQ